MIVLFCIKQNYIARHCAVSYCVVLYMIQRNTALYSLGLLIRERGNSVHIKIQMFSIIQFVPFVCPISISAFYHCVLLTISFKPLIPSHLLPSPTLDPHLISSSLVLFNFILSPLLFCSF